MPGLIMRQGPSPGVRFPMDERLILGRHRKADVVIQDPGASRRHAAVVSRGGAFRILDLGSTNGTLLNGRPIAGEAPLREGDLIQIGEEVFEFVVGESALPEPATATLHALGRRETGETTIRAGNGSSQQNGGLPRALGKFVLLSQLGRGGMGDVYLARERDGGPELAIKVIRAEIGNREAFLDFFHNREAVLAREIDHPNVIKIFEHGAVGHQHFIAMEYVPGESLLDRLKRGPIPFEEALEVLRQTACGLAAAHRRGVVHSDVKPANIMILREEAAPARAPAAEGTEDPAGEPAGVVLEFPESDRRRQPGRYDGALKEEIRRRLGDPPQDLLLDPPYFTRASETRFLRHYWEGLAGSGGYLLLVEGDPGAGKDRLLSEFVKELGLEGTLSGEFVPPPARLYELDASRIEGIPQLHQKLFPERAPLDHATRESLEEILRALEACPEPAVLRVLSLEDASPIACELLEGLVRLLPGRPILVLCGLDPQCLPRNTPLRQLLSSAEGRIKRLYLRPLSRYQIGLYLKDLFHEPVRQDRLAEDLHRLTGGNFARVLDAVRGFFQRGLLRIDRPAGRVIYQPSPRELELEEGKQFYEKYRRYGKMEQKALERAAFIGPEFLFDTLLRFSEIDETALFFIVRDLREQGFITEPARTWYRFTNQAFQRYLAERVSPRERPRLHRKVAWLLDETPLPPSPDLLRLRAYHWEEAGEHGKAAHLLLEGAHLARTEYDIDRARQMYQEILRIYRSLSQNEETRKAVTHELRTWFRRDANWYELLGNLGEEAMRVQVKITDFGISFKMEEEEVQWIDHSLPLGTPRYLAPERVRRERSGPKSDLFALGIIAYEMLTGGPPFPGKKGVEVMRSNLQKEVPIPVVAMGSPPREFFDLYRGMVEKDPDLRWDAERVLRTIAKMQIDARMGG